MKTINLYLKLIYYRFIPFFRKYQIPSTPSFDEKAGILFLKWIEKSKFYLEFGSGGSSYLAAKLYIEFISIDSDNYFIEALKEKLNKERLLNIDKHKFVFRPIGVTEMWGYPILKMPNDKMKIKFRNYSNLPIELIQERTPDLILIDGRFRVACLLKMINYLKDRNGWIVLFDNYTDRIDYHIVEKYINIDCTEGKMIQVSTLKEYSQNEILNDILKYELVCD
ncbi:MAG: hypothetical protein WAT52_15525 [Chitinophagales bacterium]